MSWIVETMIATTLLMAAVLALRGPVARMFGARVAYLLWLAPALRMILPPLPVEWLGAAAMPAPVSTFPDAMVLMTGASSPAPITSIATGDSVAWPIISLVIWLGGAALFFGWHCLAYRRFKAGVMADADYLDRDARIPIAASAAVSSPIALGILGRAVIVPADFMHRYDAVEQRLALDHELAHHRRGDLPINLVALTMLALHWFNPIAHFAHRAFRLDQEAACDAIVLTNASADERHAYGAALFKSATGAMPLAVCAMGTATQLKSRLRRIVAGVPGGAAVRIGLVAAGILVLAGLGVTASTAIADAVARPVAKHGTVIRGEKIVWQDPQEAARPASARAPEAPYASEPYPAPVAPLSPAAVAALPAPPAPPATFASAESARDAAEADADRAQADAERAQDAAEAARERAEAAREKANDAAEQARDAAADAADSHGGTDISNSCKSAHSRQVVSRSDHGNKVMVIACDKAITAYTNARTREALAAARTQIVGMTDLTSSQRSQALKELDKAISKMQAGGFSLQ